MNRDGRTMSLYGKSEWTPEEKAGLWKNVLKRTNFITKKHIAIVGDGSRHFPGLKTWSRHEIDEALKEGKFFGKRSRPTEADGRTTYERLFNSEDRYDSKMHRDDRKSVHRIGYAIQEEETKRLVPLLTSSNYGLRLTTLPGLFNRTHVRVEHVLKGFSYRRETGLPPFREQTGPSQGGTCSLGS